MSTIWFALPLFAIAAGAALCSRLTRDNRNYYPMQKVFWFAVAAVYGGSGTAALFNAPTNPVLRLVFALLMLGAVLYSLWFIRKRNATPRYVPLTLDGHTEMVPATELWHDYERAISLTAHGDAPPQWVAQMETALGQWHEEQRHPDTLGQRMKRDAEARRKAAQDDAAKGGHDDD